MADIDFAKLNLLDALDLAILIEEEAKERYEHFVELIGTRYPGDAADIFAAMAKNEAQHKAQLSARRRELFGDSPIRVNRDMIWDVEAPDQGRPRVFMSPYQAMEVAMEGEIKAHNFFRDALATVADKSVRELFSELKDEELEHQRLLQQWMDKYEGDRNPDRSDDDLDDPSAL